MARTALILILLTGCASEPPVMTEEPGARPLGHIIMCAGMKPDDPDYIFCKKQEDDDD